MYNANLSYGVRVSYDEYIVQKGDSLYTIANKYGTTVAEISDVNMLTSSVIYPGQVLLVPAKDGNTDYVLEPYTIITGDTFEKIAKRFGIELEKLSTYNDLGKFELVKGQKIKIPRENTYIINEGDTLETILRNTNRSAEELLRANASAWLKSGSQINS